MYVRNAGENAVRGKNGSRKSWVVLGSEHHRDRADVKYWVAVRMQCRREESSVSWHFDQQETLCRLRKPMANNREMSELDADPVDPAGEVSSSHEPRSFVARPWGDSVWSHGWHIGRQTSHMDRQGSSNCVRYGIAVV